MIRLAAILVVFGACAAVDVEVRPPPYIQAKTSFTRVRLYLQENIPYDVGDIRDKAFREHHGYGIIAAVLAALVDIYMQPSIEYDPLKIFYDTVPEVWNNYNQLASGPVNRLLAEAQSKILPIVNLENILCDVTETVEACNAEIDRKVRAGPRFLRNRAALLLQLGKVSDYIIKNAPHIDKVVEKDQELSYLLHNVHTDAFKSFVNELAAAYRLMRKQSQSVQN